MKTKMNFCSLLSFAALAAVGMGPLDNGPSGPSGKIVEVANPAAICRRAETVSVRWADVGVKPGDANVRVWDVVRQLAVPHQDDLEGNLIFSTPLKPLEVRQFIVTTDESVPAADLRTVCWAGYLPLRMDDFAWENDCFAMRAYGPAIMEPDPVGQKLFSSGIDVLCKRVTYPVIATWMDPDHRKRFGSYHKNHGEGMDNYKVGPSRGTGGIAQFAKGEWARSINWAEQKVVMTGPVRAVFELTYKPWGAFGKETRRVTIDRGQCFAKFTATFDGKAPDVLVGPGLDIAAARNHNGCIRVDMENAVISNFEPEDGAFGSIMTAILLCPKAGKAVVASDEMDCLYLLTKPCPEKNGIAYWAGSSWTGAGTFTKGCQWHAYVKNFAAALRAPIVVTVK